MDKIIVRQTDSLDRETRKMRPETLKEFIRCEGGSGRNVVRILLPQTKNFNLVDLYRVQGWSGRSNVTDPCTENKQRHGHHATTICRLLFQDPLPLETKHHKRVKLPHL